MALTGGSAPKGYPFHGSGVWKSRDFTCRMYGMVGKSVKFSWFIFTLDFVSHPFLFLALLVKLMGEFFYSLLLFYYLRLLFTFPFYIWLLTLYVPRLTNINILLTISIRNQQKSLRESINWSPNGKCFDLCFVFFFQILPAYFLRKCMEVRSVRTICGYLGLKG